MSKTRIFTTLESLIIIIGLALAFSYTVGAVGYGGRSSDRVIGLTGLANSHLVIGSAVANSLLDIMPFASPTVTTSAAGTRYSTSVVINGNVVDAGTALNETVYFEYGATPAMGQTTAPVVKTGTGSFSASITGLGVYDTLYYRAVAIADGVTTYGVVLSVPPVPGASAASAILGGALRILVAAGLLILVVKFVGIGVGVGQLTGAVIGIVAFGIIDAILNILGI